MKQFKKTLAALSLVGSLAFQSTASSGEPSHDHRVDRSAHDCETCFGVDRDPGTPAKPARKRPGDIDQGDCPSKRYRMDDDERSGHPTRVAPWARCSTDGKYSAWFVGGGAAFANVPQLPAAILSRGRGRHSNSDHQHGEGTWGLDYGGFFSKANVWLNYTQGREQGGEGAYRTDGEPKVVSKAKSLLHFFKEE